MANENLSRRGFLKTIGLAGAALTIRPTVNKIHAAGNQLQATDNGIPHRKLGTGKAALDVSALGFGVMGMTYNRSQHPDKNKKNTTSYTDKSRIIAYLTLAGNSVSASYHIAR